MRLDTMPRLFKVQLQAGKPLIRHETFEGRDHLVVPVVMIVEGVLNGALVPTEELVASAEAWNGRPVPILHPQRGEEYVSANDPRVIERARRVITMVDGAVAKDERRAGE